MLNTNNLILDLINKNASVNEITSITGLSHTELFDRMNLLKIKGYDFKRKYYDTGDIAYSLIKEINSEENVGKTILTNNTDNFKMMLFSDLHLGNINERLDLLYLAYEKCIKDNIHVIINAGDLIDGPKGYGNLQEKKILDAEAQIEYLLKNYPFDKNIINFICLGNHDYACLKEDGLDLAKMLENKRHDLVSLGYGLGYLNIKNDQIIITHPTEAIRYESVNKKIIFAGHSHRYKNTISPVNAKIYLPSLSDMKSIDIEGEHSPLPSFLVVNMYFKNGIIIKGNFEQYVFVNNKMVKMSESYYDLIMGKNISLKNINNIERKTHLKENEIKEILLKNDIIEEKKEETEVKQEQNKVKKLQLSMIEKFNKKWNR